jgi:hypothetical protein
MNAASRCEVISAQDLAEFHLQISGCPATTSTSASADGKTQQNHKAKDDGDSEA